MPGLSVRDAYRGIGDIADSLREFGSV